MTMLRRHLAVPLRRAALMDAPLLLQGPRGAGKTTLVRRELSSRLYITLDDPADRASARSDPARFLARLRRPTVIDEFQRAPELIRHLRIAPISLPVAFVSSLKLSLPVETLELHPPTRAELERRPAMPLELLGRFVPAAPRQPLESAPWVQNREFLWKDIPLLVQAHEPDLIERLFDLIAARSGAPLDRQALARELCVAHRTVARWLDALDACFATLSLAPLDLPLGRRLVRRRKLHVHAATSSFETEVVSEIYRNARHAGLDPELRYWRDSNGREVALVLRIEPESPPVPVAIEAIPSRRDLEWLKRWIQLAGLPAAAIVTRVPAPPELRTSRVLCYTSAQL